MNVASTTEKGNRFRDTIDAMIAAAGFHPQKEVREQFKKVDIGATWIRDSFDGPQRYLIEAKDYAGTLGLDECSAFATQYGALVRNGNADRAWLISRGPISPDGRALIEADRNLKCFTYEEFQRRLFGIDTYLRDLVAAYEGDQIAAYYIRPHTDNDHDLERVVRDWMDDAEAPPLAVVSGYGKGKSTFARHLAAELAAEALTDPTRRVPILVPLGEIVDEQSLEGLLGKLFTSRYRAQNYHFHLFEELNREGRFVVIFDGFDEMKHGMTLPVFERNIAELMRLDRGRAKILLLGRDTAFHDEVEFRAIILGRQITSGGSEVRARERRECRYVNLREFSLPEAQQYVRHYFPLKAREAARGQQEQPDEAWIQRRAAELTSGMLDELLVRPVHAQMLCEIATDPEIELNHLSKFSLYDRFVHFLLDREVRKAGRDPAFNIDVRRRFNSGLAWWLWEQGAVSTTTLANIPASLCSEATKGIFHDYDDVGLRRELTAGCLVEKSQGTIYFGHRSIQEFLVAERLVETDLLYRRETDRGDIGKLLPLLNAEVIEFICERVAVSPTLHKRAETWLSYLDGWRPRKVSLEHLELFARLAQIARLPPDAAGRSPWHYWLAFFAANGRADFQIRPSAAGSRLTELIDLAMDDGPELQAAAFVLMARVLGRDAGSHQNLAAAFVAAWLPHRHLGDAVSEAHELKKKKVERVIISQSKSFKLWMFLVCMSVERDQSGEAVLVIDLRQLERRATAILKMGFDEEHDHAQHGGKISIPVQRVYQAVIQRKGSQSDVKRLRLFFNEEWLRKRIRPLEVEIIGRREHSALTP